MTELRLSLLFLVSVFLVASSFEMFPHFSMNVPNKKLSLNGANLKFVVFHVSASFLQLKKFTVICV